MRIAIDLCGTTHDAKEANYRGITEMCQSFGRRVPDKDSLYHDVWTGHDWIGFWRKLGFTTEEAREAEACWHDLYLRHEPSALISGADALFAYDPAVLTAARMDVVALRFRAHGLERHLGSVHAHLDSKAAALAALPGAIVYVGDSTGDGAAVALARAQGKDAFFIGVTHAYGFMPDAVRAFCAKNKGFALIAERLEDVPARIEDISTA